MFALAVLLLWAFFAQCVTSMVVKSPTVDEQIHLTRGYVYLEMGDLRFKIGHPILVNALNAVPVWALADLTIPTDHPSWQNGRWSVFTDHFIWRSGNPVTEIFFLGRWVTVVIGLLGAATVFRWAREWFGSRAGLLSLTLFVFDPNMLAHSRLVTDDVAVAVFALVAAYGMWRYFVTRWWSFLLLSGLAFGWAQGAKFSAAVLVPVFFLLAPWWSGGRQTAPLPFRKRLVGAWGAVLVILFLAGLFLWTGYGFDFGYLEQVSLPFPVPAPDYFDDLLWQSRYFGREHRAFLMGRISPTGWWYYDLVTLALKAPLPLLGLSVVTVVCSLRCRSSHWELLIPVALFVAAAMYSPLDIGFRYLLLLLPILYVYISQLVDAAWGTERAQSPLSRLYIALLLASIAWLALGTLAVSPHYLAYFNELAGGPDGGYRYLVDSNLDWGQDLPGLRTWQVAHADQPLKLSYFGTAHPSYYDLNFEPLPTWDPAPEQGNLYTRTFYPHAPAPGVYAISATNLQGVVLRDPETFAWFRDKHPFAKAGYSIFLYRVEPTGPPVDVALAGLQVDELAPETFSSFGTNDVRLRWFDASTSLILPSEPGWFVAPDIVGLSAWGWDTTHPCTTTAGQACRLYPPDPAAHAAAVTRAEHLTATSQAGRCQAPVPSSDAEISPLALPVDLGGQLEFLGYEPPDDDITTPVCDLQFGACNILTVWRVIAPPDGPRAIFVHLLAPDGQVAAQWDGLDVPVEGWRVGDTILQTVSFGLPPDLPPGRYWLQTGVYDPATMVRLPVLAEGATRADRILLEAVNVGELP